MHLIIRHRLNCLSPFGDLRVLPSAQDAKRELMR